MSLVSRIGRLTTKTGRFWTEAYLLYLAARDSRVPVYARLAAAAFAIYVIAPIDVVPDPIPLIGIVDDFLIIPIGLILIRNLVPEYLRNEHQEIAVARQPERPGFSEAYGFVLDTVKRVPLPENLGVRDAATRMRAKWGR
ncbi:MAG: DUF1232 domain-containing protein [Thermomicrobiales bacterium]